jgi:DNA polymerase-1
VTYNKDRAFFERGPSASKVPLPPLPSQPAPDVDSLGAWFDWGKMVYIDTETTNGHNKGSLDAFDPESNIAIVQTCIDGKIEIRRWSDQTRDWIKDLNDKGYTFVFHNAAFDLFFLRMKGGIELTNVFDTMIASQVINAGKEKVDEATRISRRQEVNTDGVDDIMAELFDEEDSEDLDPEALTKKANFYSHSLGAVVFRYTKEKIVKDLGNSDWSRDPLTPEQVRYAEDDVRYLERVVKNMLFIAKKYGMTKVLKLEMELIPAVVDMRYNGILLDKENWKVKIGEYAEMADELETELNYSMGLELAEREDQGDSLFGIMPLDFSVGSNTQLLKFFKDEIIDGKPIAKVDETTLKIIKHPVIKKILTFKEYKKLATTYGEGYLKHIRPEDGRIHAALLQTSDSKGKAIATGRFSSSNPNLQNIPAKLIKSLLRSEEGWLLLTADYSSVESRILAYAANDKNYIASVNSKDIHRENASKMFKITLDMVTSTQRSSAKVLSFAVPYGASAMGMWQKGLGDTLEEAEQLINDFFTAFPQVKKYLDSQVVDALTRGYTQDKYGRVRWYEIPKRGDATSDEISSAERAAKRQAQNFGIQALSASVTKMAIKNLYRLFKTVDWGRMLLTIHDSVFFEIKHDKVVEAIPLIRKIMVDAATEIMDTLVAPVDFEIGQYRELTDKLAGIKFYAYEYEIEDGKLVWNEPILSEDSEKILKSLGIPQTDDLQGMYQQVSEKLELQTPEWHDANKKWVTSFRNLAR